MSVAADFRIDIRPYSGYVDPSLPIATYVGQASLVGDASGGDLTFNFLYQRGDDAQISEMFNLEQIAMDSTINGTLPVTMRLFSMDSLSQNRPMFGQIWSLLLEAESGSTNSALANEHPKLPLWLGAPNRDEGDGLILFRVPNVDLQLYAVTIQGYVWGPRSVLAPGGPQRPIAALWG